MACVCFVCLCDVHHLDKRIYKQCSGIYQEWQGRQWARVPPPPPRAERRLGYPRANFFYFSKQIFYFFLPYPITSSIYSFFLLLRGFIFLCVYFPIRVSFRVSEGKKKQGNMDCFFLLSCVCVVIMRSILILCYFPMLCFSPVFLLFFSCVSLLYLPVISPFVLCFCIVFCCGCCVFR